MITEQQRAQAVAELRQDLVDQGEDPSTLESCYHLVVQRDYLWAVQTISEPTALCWTQRQGWHWEDEPPLPLELTLKIRDFPEGFADDERMYEAFRLGQDVNYVRVMTDRPGWLPDQEFEDARASSRDGVRKYVHDYMIEEIRRG